jgi:hypothetical protein
LSPSLNGIHIVNQGCQIFLCTTDQKWGKIYQIITKYTKSPQNIPNYHKIYQWPQNIPVATKYTSGHKIYQWPQNIPNHHLIYQITTKYTNIHKIFQLAVCKIDQMSLKYTNITHCKALQNVPKLEIFGLKIYYLATTTYIGKIET